jgi:hypothetical protein
MSVLDSIFVLLQEVKVGDQLEESGENVFVGGKNRWRYSTFVNWELWWPQFPILVYFKETQTKPEGQIHFFPVIFVSPLILLTLLLYHMEFDLVLACCNTERPTAL